MGYKLKRKEELGEGVSRVAGEQVDKIEALLSKKEALREAERIHKARKAVKKVRALLRVVRVGLGTRSYQDENRRYRAIARQASPWRDAKTLSEAVKKLQKRYDESVYAGCFNSATRYLQERQRHALGEGEQTRRQMLVLAKRAKTRISQWPLDKLKWSDLLAGLKRTYKRNRRALARVQTTPTNAHLHEWRKRAKDLRYQLRLLRNAGPEVIKDWAGGLKTLTHYLGDDHDFAMLADVLQEKSVPEQTREIITSLIRTRRTQLQRVALDLGCRLYVERPRAFAKRIARYCKLWRQGCPLTCWDHHPRSSGMPVPFNRLTVPSDPN